jgi:hypothetical protein
MKACVEMGAIPKPLGLGIRFKVIRCYNGLWYRFIVASCWLGVLFIDYLKSSCGGSLK